MRISRLIEYIPPEVIFHRRPLADEENAWFPWREAINALSLPNRDTKEGDLLGRLRWGNPDASPDDNTPVHIETDWERECAAGVLERNRRVLDLLDEGVRRGRFRIPDREFRATMDDDKSMIEAEDVVWGIERHAYDLLLLRLKLDQANSGFAGMVDHILALLRMGKMICGSDSEVSHFIMGTMHQKRALSGVARLASKIAIPRDILSRLADTIEELTANADDLVRCIGVDFCYYTLNRLDRLPEGVDHQTFVDEWLRRYYADISIMPPTYDSQEIEENLAKYREEHGRDPERLEDFIFKKEDPEDAADLRERLRWRREKLFRLLDGHPCPFDKKATARLMAGRILEWVDWLRQVSGEEFRQYEGPIVSCIWPQHLHPEFPVDYLGDSPQVQRRIAEATKLRGGSEPSADWPPHSPPTDAELESTRQRLLAIDNPVGRLLAEAVNEQAGASVFEQLRKQFDETQEVLRKRLQSS